MSILKSDNTSIHRIFTVKEFIQETMYSHICVGCHVHWYESNRRRVLLYWSSNHFWINKRYLTEMADSV